MATCWNNGKHHTSGAGYGIKLTLAERDTLLDRSWEGVVLILPDGTATQPVRCDKKSMWGNDDDDGKCRELIHQDIGKWMLRSGLAPWPRQHPHRLKLEKDTGRRLRVTVSHKF